MWFNPHAKLVEIAGHPPATSATTATKAPALRAVSRLSQPPEVQKPTFNVAEVASVATLAPETDPSPMDSREAETRFPHAYSALGGPVTWTGRVVSLVDWRNLNEWERHGPDGRHWNGTTKRWEQLEGSKP
jgi:hypothetical protein